MVDLSAQAQTLGLLWLSSYLTDAEESGWEKQGGQMTLCHYDATPSLLCECHAFTCMYERGRALFWWNCWIPQTLLHWNFKNRIISHCANIMGT